MKIPNWHKLLWKEESEEEPTMMVFWWGWCKSCESPYLECPLCGNSSCNAGTGYIDNKPCPICWLSYQYECLAVKYDEYPKTEDEVDFYNNEILNRLGVNKNGVLLRHLTE